MNRKFILPHEKPPINSWTWHANLLSILYAYPPAKDWIYSNYLGLFITDLDRTQRRQVLDFWPRFSITKECPYIFTQVLKRETINHITKGDIIDFFCFMIKNGNYIYGIFNEFFIAGEYLPHELFIYGFDDDKRTFLTADFTYGITYSSKPIKYEEIAKSYETLKECDDYMFQGRGGIHFLSYYPDVNYKMDTNHLKRSIDDYLNSNNLSKYDTCKCNEIKFGKYGIEAYNQLIRNIDDKELGLDTRILAVLRDHKHMQWLREIYLKEKGLLPYDSCFDFKKIYEEVSLLLNIAIKANMTNKIIDSQVKEKLCELKALEEFSLQNLRNMLNDSCVEAQVWTEKFYNRDEVL